LNSNKHTSEPPQSLNDLITSLLEGEQAAYNQIIRSATFSANDFSAYASWSEACYTRNCIVHNEKFELILICWCEGHQTPIHDHGGEECWVTVIDGALKETIYKQTEEGHLHPVRSFISKPNNVTYMKDFMGFHRLQNAAHKKSMSLHLYAKPIAHCRAFNEASKMFVKRELEYDTSAE
jgi:cysteine dioxygenase